MKKCIFAEKYYLCKMEKIITIVGKSMIWLLGAVWGYLQPTLPFAGICFFAIVLDCFTAWRLAQRIKIYHPELGSDGKFRSDKAKKIFSTLFVIYACIVLGYAIDTKICTGASLGVANWIAGGFCFVQLWSILENESSENGSTWAKVLQKIMVNKASRHIGEISSTIDEVMSESRK